MVSRPQFSNMIRVPLPRYETCYQIALAIQNEVEDLEKAGINVIQIDEAALREGLPLRKSEQAYYLEWAVHSFRITNCGVKDTTQVYSLSPLFRHHCLAFCFIMVASVLIFHLSTTNRFTPTCATLTSMTSSTQLLTWMLM